MKILRKINKGLLLTLLVVLILLIYIFRLEQTRKLQKNEILNVCKNYIEMLNNYTKLPNEYQNPNNLISETDLNNYIKSAETDMQKYMISNDSSIQTQLTLLKEGLSKNNTSSSTIIKYNYEIVKPKNYEFDRNQVTINLLCNVQIETKNEFDQINSSTLPQQTFQIIVNKENNTWKIVYSDLLLPFSYYSADPYAPTADYTYLN